MIEMQPREVADTVVLGLNLRHDNFLPSNSYFALSMHHSLRRIIRGPRERAACATACIAVETNSGWNRGHKPRYSGRRRTALVTRRYVTQRGEHGSKANRYSHW